MLFSFAHCLSLGVLDQITEILTSSSLLQTEPELINCVQTFSTAVADDRDTFER